jgi:hypothetical protein
MPQTPNTVAYPVSVPPPSEVDFNPPPTIGESVAAGFRLENPDKAAFNLMTQDVFPPEPGFDIVGALKKRNLMDQSDLYNQALSNKELDAMVAKVEHDRQDRLTAARGGWWGTVGYVLGGGASVTNLLPFVGEERGAKAFYDAARLALLNVGAQEIPLQFDQPERTGAEGFLNITAGTVLGGLMGGAFKNLTARELDKAVYDMAVVPGTEAIPRPHTPATSDELLTQLKPVAGEFQVPRPDETGFSSAAGDMTNFVTIKPKNMLVVGPETLDHLNLGGKSTAEILDYARAAGHDAVAFEGTGVPGIHVLDPAIIAPNPRLHGARKEIVGPLGEDHYSTMSYYGQGFYSTDSAAIAKGYSKRTGKIYRLTERGPVNALNMEEAVPEWLVADDLKTTDTFSTSDLVAEAMDKNPKNVRELYDTIRDLSRGYGLSSDSVQEVFANFIDRLLAKGFNALDHIGGLRTGKLPHQVRIYLEPYKSVDLTPFTPDTYFPRFGPGVETIPVPAPATPAAAGAAAVNIRDPGGLKSGYFNWLKFMNPVARVIDDFSLVGRRMMAMMSTGGVESKLMEKGMTPAVGGTVEHRQAWFRALEAMSHQGVDRFFNEYQVGSGATGVIANAKASFNALRTPSKMDRNGFEEAVSDAFWNSVEVGKPLHDVPEVQAAAEFLRDKVYVPLRDMGIDVKLPGFSPDMKLVADLSYLSRNFHQGKMNARTGQFIDVVAGEFNTELQQEFKKTFESFQKRQLKAVTRAEDIGRPIEEAVALRQKFIDELGALDKNNPDLVNYEDEIAIKRKAAAGVDLTPQEQAFVPGAMRPLKSSAAGKEQRAALRAEAKAIKAAGGEPLAEFRGQKAALRQRIKNLNRNRFVLEQKARAKLDKVDTAESNSIASLNRAVRSGQRFLGEINSISDKNMAARLRDLRTAFADAAGTFDKGEEQIVKEANTEPGRFSDLMAMQDKQVTRSERLTAIADRLGDAEAFDAPEWRKLIQEGMDEMLGKVNDLNVRRAARNERLRAQAADMSPEVTDAYLAELKARNAERQGKFIERFKSKAAIGSDLLAGSADFTEHARSIAQQIAGDIMRVGDRAPMLDILASARGLEKERVLRIASRKIDFVLEKNIKTLLTRYVRTFGSDYEMTRVFGSPNAASWLGKLEDGGALAVEQFAAVERLKEKNLSPAQLEKATVRLNDGYKRIRRDLEATVSRIRHTWGVPRNPAGAAYRLGQAAMHINALRFLGGVVISSLQDPARVTMKHGLKYAFGPETLKLMTSQKGLRQSKRQAFISGAGTDMEIHGSQMRMSEVLSDYGMDTTKPERALKWAASHAGLIFGFDYWTSWMKRYAATVTNLHMVDAMDLVLHGEAARPHVGRATAADIKSATEWLAFKGIDNTDGRLERIWNRMMQPGGHDDLNGVIYPNTEAWTTALEGPELALAREDVMHYNAMVGGDINDTIVTPGLEVPLFANEHWLEKMLFQFKSFAFSSISKTVIAGGQQKDMAALAGSLFSLAMGSLSYYLYATIRGGQVYEDMQNADLDKWIAEMVSRSGLQPAFDSTSALTQLIPGVQEALKVLPEPMRAALIPLGFTKAKVTRREPGDIVAQAAGPTYDLAVKKMLAVILSMDHPTQSTLHKARQMFPGNNLSGFSRFLDGVEAYFGQNLPKKRARHQ